MAVKKLIKALGSLTKLLLIAAATDTRRPPGDAAFMGTDELRAVQTGMTSANESQRAEATVILTSRD